jgi:hypothetical protein
MITVSNLGIAKHIGRANYGDNAPNIPCCVIARSESDEAIHSSASGAVDCFAEPVIGRAFVRPVGSPDEVGSSGATK